MRITPDYLHFINTPVCKQPRGSFHQVILIPESTVRVHSEVSTLLVHGTGRVAGHMHMLYVDVVGDLINRPRFFTYGG